MSTFYSWCHRSSSQLLEEQGEGTGRTVFPRFRLQAHGGGSCLSCPRRLLRPSTAPSSPSCARAQGLECQLQWEREIGVTELTAPSVTRGTMSEGLLHPQSCQWRERVCVCQGVLGAEPVGGTGHYLGEHASSAPGSPLTCRKDCPAGQPCTGHTRASRPAWLWLSMFSPNPSP